MRRILKFPTGAEVPANSKYLATVRQEWAYQPAEKGVFMAPDGTWDEEEQEIRPGRWERCWFVWHYYEVET